MNRSKQAALQGTQPKMLLQWAKRAALVLLTSGVTGKAGLLISFVNPEISLIWLPAGIGVAALLRWGETMFIPVFISALLLSLDSNLNWGVAAFIGFSNALGSMVCFWILRNRQFYKHVMQLRDVFWLCIAAFIAMAIPATLGTTALVHEGLSFEPQLTWLCWWAGDTVGVLLATPLILAFSLRNFRQLRGRVNELVVFLALFGLLHWLIFFSSHHSLHLIFLTMASMIWAALRFNMSVVPLIVMASSLCSIWATYNATGPFSAAEIQENMFVLWLYIATISVSAMFITALQTERHMANEKLRESYERIHKVASRLPGVIMQVRVPRDGKMTIPFASDGLFALFGADEDAVRHDAQQLFSAIEPDDKEKCLEALRTARANTGIWQSEVRRINAQGSERWLYIDGMPETEADGALLWHCFISDITNRKVIEHDLRIAATTFESQEGMFVTNHRWRILKFNQAFSRITGYTATDQIGMAALRHTIKHQDATFFKNIEASLIHESFWQGELWAKRKNGETYPQMMTLTAIKDARGMVTNYVGSFTDMSQHKGYEEEIRTLAFYDLLTKLPNRRLLTDRLQHLISMHQRNDRHSAILFIDLDNFKTLNDTRGHDAGDLLLIEAAKRLLGCVRESDTVARFGGDEFVVILEELSTHLDEAVTQADRIGEKIRHSLNQTFDFPEFSHHGSCSIGICLFQGAENNVKDLFKRADTAMYQAKTSGRNALRFFDPEMQAVLVIRMMLESNLRVALALEQFQLYYQAQVDALGKVVGAEALLRWLHPERGFISPAEFIPLAEETGLIVPIGHWVLEQACKQLKLWEGETATQHLSLAVNVSAKQFKQNDFVASVTDIIKKQGINPSLLKIELTESTVLDDVESTTRKMHQLKSLGVGFSMDDFGTGYSSLAYLQRLPLNQIKIDQSFVRDISDDENDATIVRTIISLGLNLGLNVIAEGVETLAQRDFLIQHHCLAFQGYLFARPLPIEGFHAMFALPNTTETPLTDA